MKRLLLLCLFPLIFFGQDTSLVGDVDCNGQITSEDASLILQYVTSVIESLPCQENMNGLSPDQLQEMINLINAQVDISPNETITMIGPMYNSDDFPDFLTWDSEEGASIYYADAFRFCAQLVYEGYEDWRLPTISAIHNHVQENPESEFIIPNHDTTGWGSFWTSAMNDNPSAAITANTMLAYIVPLINISGSNHQTLPNQILFYAAENSYNMSNCFCVR